MAAVGALVSAATAFYNSVNKVTINTKQCALLEERVKAIVGCVEADPRIVSTTTTAALDHLVTVVRRCADGVADFGDEGKLKRAWNKDIDSRRFEQLNESLYGAAAVLGLSLQMDAVFDRENDKRAQAADNLFIRSSLNSISAQVAGVDDAAGRIHTSVDSLHAKVDGVSTQLGMLSLNVSLPPKSAIDFNAYAAKCRKVFATLPNLDYIEGTSGSAYRELGLSDVFVAQSVRPCNSLPMAHLEIPEEHRHRFLGSTSEISRDPLSVTTLLEDDHVKLAVILGQPGAGKTSALRERVLDWANADALKRSVMPFVILVELRQYGNERIAHNGVLTLEDYIVNGGSVHFPLDRDALVRQLTDARTLVLLDGLDEVFQPTLRTSVVHYIATFAETYRSASCRIVLTSRIVGYDMAELAKCGFAHYVLEPFSDKQIDVFIHNWHTVAYKTVEAELCAERMTRLRRAVSTVPSLRALCRNPLLLTMLAILNRGPELPTKRVRLYEKCVELLITRWEASKKPEHTDGTPVDAFDFDQKEKMLRDLAWEMHKDTVLLGNIVNETTVIRVFSNTVRDSLERAEPRLVSRSLLEKFRERHGILCFLGAKEYAFVHRTFLEYLCARAIYELLAENAMSANDLRDLFVNGASNATRHEILRLLSGMAPTVRVAPCLDAVISVNPILAAECAQQLREPPKASDAVAKLRKPLEQIAMRFLDFDQSVFLTKLIEDTNQALSILPTLWHDDATQ